MFIVMTPPAIVQSFDCQKASSAIEKMICATPELARLDEEMARAFAAARQRAGGAVPGQQAWLKNIRDECANAACLKRVYETRIMFLKGVGPVIPLASPGLAGDWTRVGAFEGAPGALHITDVTARGFSFELFAQSGNSVGQIEGAAAINGADAIFRDAESKCEVKFRRTERRISVATSSGCSYFAGMGVSFAGEYGRGEPAAPSPTLTEMEILAPGVTEQAFAALVGKEFDLFVQSFSLYGPDEDIDRLGAKVMSGTVRGLRGEREAIVMSRSDGKIMAAVIDVDVVKYFSNDPAFKTKLPDTIERWRADFKDLKIQFMSR